MLEHLAEHLHRLGDGAGAFALAVMGVAVHAVRLNTLEFSNGLGQEWSGFAFTPFAKQKN